MSALFHPYLCGRNAAEWLIKMKAQDADSYPEIAEKLADCIDDVEEDLPSPSYAELAAATNILMGGENA